MPDWLGSFKLPKFTDEKYEKQKAAYNEKHGYTVQLPAWDDIIKLKYFPPLTDQEKSWWKKKQTGNFTVERLNQIRKHKEKAKTRYLASLASPSPKIVRSAAAVLTSLDNAQDAIATLAVIAKIAAVVVGGATLAALSGPIGWIAGAATLLQLINPYSFLKKGKKFPMGGRGAKKDLEKHTDKNPFSKKARAKVAKNLHKFRPSVGNAIEALQVTDNIFGVGISIGPIMGFGQDLIAGGVRKLMGEKVSFKKLAPDVPIHARKALRNLKDQAVLHGYAWKSDMTEEMIALISANLALQVAHPYLQDWNVFDEVEDLENCMIEAPRPTDILILEIIEESGRTLDEVCNWPQNGERWITLGELQEKTAPQAAANLRHFAEKYPNSVEAFIAGQNAHDFALGVIETIEGLEQVEIEYSKTERIIIIILDNGWEYPKDITDEQIDKFEDWCYVHEYMDTMPSYKDIWRYAEIFCGFRWAKSPDEYR